MKLTPRLSLSPHLLLLDTCLHTSVVLLAPFLFMYSQLTRRAIPWTRRSGQTLGLGSSCGLWFHIWVSCQEGGRPWQRGRSVQSTNQLGVGRNIQSPETDHNIHEKITHLDKWLPFIVKTFYKERSKKNQKINQSFLRNPHRLLSYLIFSKIHSICSLFPI